MVFWSNQRHQKDIMKWTDLMNFLSQLFYYTGIRIFYVKLALKPNLAPVRNRCHVLSIALQEWRKVEIFGGAVKHKLFLLKGEENLGGPINFPPPPLVFQVPPALHYWGLNCLGNKFMTIFYFSLALLLWLGLVIKGSPKRIDSPSFSRYDIVFSRVLSQYRDFLQLNFISMF